MYKLSISTSSAVVSIWICNLVYRRLSTLLTRNTFITQRRPSSSVAKNVLLRIKGVYYIVCCPTMSCFRKTNFLSTEFISPTSIVYTCLLIRVPIVHSGRLPPLFRAHWQVQLHNGTHLSANMLFVVMTINPSESTHIYIYIHSLTGMEAGAIASEEQLV